MLAITEADVRKVLNARHHYKVKNGSLDACVQWIMPELCLLSYTVEPDGNVSMIYKDLRSSLQNYCTVKIYLSLFIFDSVFVIYLFHGPPFMAATHLHFFFFSFTETC